MASYEEVKAAADYLRSKVPTKPLVGLICGSGLAKLGESIKDPIIIPYEEIPNFTKSTGKD